MAFSVSNRVNRTEAPYPYYDVIFLCGLNDSEWIYDIMDIQLQEITSSSNLSYFYSRGSDLPRIKADMLILLAHGNPYQTRIGGKVYSNQEMFYFLTLAEINYFISESCSSGRFLSLPSSLIYSMSTSRLAT